MNIIPPHFTLAGAPPAPLVYMVDDGEETRYGDLVIPGHEPVFLCSADLLRQKDDGDTKCYFGSTRLAPDIANYSWRGLYVLVYEMYTEPTESEPGTYTIYTKANCAEEDRVVVLQAAQDCIERERRRKAAGLVGPYNVYSLMLNGETNKDPRAMDRDYLIWKSPIHPRTCGADIYAEYPDGWIGDNPPWFVNRKESDPSHK